MTQDEPCILLHRVVPDGELVEVATGTVVQPKSRDLHNVIMDNDVMRIKIANVVPEFRDVLPPFQPPGSDQANVVLGDCTSWIMKWPKNQIRLGGGLVGLRRSTGATSPLVRPNQIVRPAKLTAVRKKLEVAAPRKETTVVATTRMEPAVVATTQLEPAVVATTTRHKQLLGTLPQRPPKGKAFVPQPPASQPPPPKAVDMALLDGHNYEYDDDNVDIDAYINTGACSKDMYMPPMDDEEAFRNHGDQPRCLTTVTQRLTFQGFSQEDTPPEAGDPAQVKQGTIFSPNTLHKTVDAVGAPAPPAPPAPTAPPADQSKKKQRKRSNNKGAAASQPLPTKRIRQDDVVPPHPDGLTQCHEAGQPILPSHMVRLATGAMLTLQSNIKYLEDILLKDECPNYPVFTAKVPEDPDFVHEDPAELFFIAFEDVFKLFHSRRLDYNLVRLYALSVQIKIKRESPPNVAVADPYYMRDSQLVEGSRTRIKAVEYLKSFILRNLGKNNLLVPVFPE